MTAEDFLCDFCLRHWADDRPMVEGHRGSLLCGPCLTVAYTQVVFLGQGVKVIDRVCTLCLSQKDGPHWISPATSAPACADCLEQAAKRLERDRDSGWNRPTA